MTKETIYTYLGTNGTITSPVRLEGIYSVKHIRLTADTDKWLTNGDRLCESAVIDTEDLDKWYEISK